LDAPEHVEVDVESAEESAAASSGCRCGTPGRASFVSPEQSATFDLGTAHDVGHGVEQVRVPGGTFVMGDSSGDRNPGDGELPLHEVTVGEFEIDATTVTNDDFARFVAATGFRTEAEEWASPPCSTWPCRQCWPT
jgi:formylglycine-generating enzyme